MQKDRDAFFCEGVSPKIVRGTGRIFGVDRIVLALMILRSCWATAARMWTVRKASPEFCAFCINFPHPCFPAGDEGTEARLYRFPRDHTRGFVPQIVSPCCPPSGWKLMRELLRGAVEVAAR